MLKRWMRAGVLIETMFSRDREAEFPWLVRGWIAAQYLAGALVWACVMGWGTAPLNYHDWTDINVPRLLFVQQALREGHWPLHMAGTASLHGVTDRFLTLPDVITTPQMLLLVVMPVPAFVVVDTLIEFTIGFVGVWLLRRYVGWSLYAWTFVTWLMLLNGHILAHYTVGHVTWGAYFAFPFVWLLLFRFLDGDASWRLIAAFAGVMGYMVIAGGQHHMTWVMLFVGIMALFCGRRAWWPLVAVAASGLVAAVRLLPPVLEIRSFHEAGLVSDIIGYPSFTHLLSSLVVLRREHPAFNEALPANIWFFDSAYFEFNAYVGLAGAIVIAIFGVRYWVQHSQRYRPLMVPALAMTAMSLGTVYRIVRASGIPLFDSERYTARMFILPLTLLIIMAGLHLDDFLRRRAHSVWQRSVALIGLAFIVLDLLTNAMTSTLTVSARLFGPSTFDMAGTAVRLRADAAYTNLLLAGLAITLSASALLAWLVFRERRTPIGAIHAS